MSTSLRSSASTVAVAAFTALLVAGAPAVARNASSLARAGIDADTVHGFTAVGCHADLARRSGKLVATCARTGRLPNDIIARAPDSNLLDGRDSSEFLGVGQTAANSRLLDGLDSTDFLGIAGTAADSDLLDGRDSSEFLGIGARAADSDLLDGVDSSGFVLDGETVATASNADNADRLDGIDSTGFMLRAIYRITQSGTGTCSNGDDCFLRVDCRSGDTLLSGGFDSIDNGTRLVASRPGKDLSNAQPTAFGWVVWWNNNSTPDTVEVTIICADS